MHVYVLSEMGEKTLDVDCVFVDLFVFALGYVCTIVLACHIHVLTV